MKKIFARDGLTLGAGTVRQLAVGQNGKLRVVQGQLWITIAGQPEDHWLSAHQTLCLQARDRITVQAQTDDAMLILDPIKSGAGAALKKWSLSLPFVGGLFGHRAHAAGAGDVTSDFFQQWSARQCRINAN